MAPIILLQTSAQTGIGRLLQPGVYRRVDGVPVGIGLVPVPLHHLSAYHLGDVGRLCIDPGRMQCCGGGLLTCRFGRLTRDVAELFHSTEDVIPPLECAFRVRDRVEARRRLRQARDHCQLGQVKFVHPLAVVDLGRRSYTVGTVPHVDLVQVQFEDLLFRQVLFDAKGEEDLVEFPQKRLFTRKVEVACYLHRDGASALAPLAGEGQLQRRPQDALVIDAGVFEKTVVLCGQKCLYDLLGNLHVFQRNASFLAKFRDQVAIGRVDAQRDLETDIFEVFGGRELGFQVKIER